MHAFKLIYRHIAQPSTSFSLYRYWGSCRFICPCDRSNIREKNVALLNEAQCDIATIGNNEGMTISHEALNTLYDDAHFKVICTNVLDEQGQLPNHIATSYIQNIEGTRILLLLQLHHLRHFIVR